MSSHRLGVDLLAVHRVAVETRADFESERVTDSEILESAKQLGGVYAISDRWTNYEERNRRVAEGTMVKVGGFTVALPIIGRTDSLPFPKGFCNLTSPVLASRLMESGALGEYEAEVIIGGCERDMEVLDEVIFHHNHHTFVGIGETALGSDTIVDITADQFGTGLAAVYIGPLVDPWTRDPFEAL